MIGCDIDTAHTLISGGRVHIDDEASHAPRRAESFERARVDIVNRADIAARVARYKRDDWLVCEQGSFLSHTNRCVNAAKGFYFP